MPLAWSRAGPLFVPNSSLRTSGFCVPHWCCWGNWPCQCCDGCHARERSVALYYLHIEKTGGSAIECATVELARRGILIPMGHTMHRHVLDCQVRCGAAPVMISVRNPVCATRERLRPSSDSIKVMHKASAHRVMLCPRACPPHCRSTLTTSPNTRCQELARLAESAPPSDSLSVSCDASTQYIHAGQGPSSSGSHARAFASIAHMDPSTGRRSFPVSPLSSFGAWIRYVVKHAPQFTQSARIERSCGRPCNHEYVVRTESLEMDLNRALRGAGGPYIVINTVGANGISQGKSC